jgi:hypothetical protein
MRKNEDEKSEKAQRIWVHGEVLHLIVLKGELEFEFTKSAKNDI